MTKTIVEIEVVDVEKRRVPSKHYVYVIVVKWSDNSSMVIYRRYSRFFDLQTQLLDKFPIESGSADPSLRIMPFLPGKIFFGRSQIREVAMKRLGEIDAYCKSILALPHHISQCEEVLEFFEVEAEDLDPPKEDNVKSKGEKKAEKISTPKHLEQFLAVANYDSQEKGEMDLQAGMVVEVTEKSESGWWFVNAEEQQGWVPSTYLQPVNGSAVSAAPTAKEGEEEKYICIETFTADNADEVSLEKGVMVEVLQKNMDGWWNVRYQGQEGFAPATYLKKSSDPYAKSLVEKSRQSGVKIISNLSDISTIMTSTNSPRNSAIITPNSTSKNTNLPHNASTTSASSTATNFSSSASRGDSILSAKEEEWDQEWDDDSSETTPHSSGPKGDSYATVMVKQKSLERGGSLKPPPRQNSVRQLMNNAPPSSPPKTKSSAYITVADFEDTVGDGISFTSGEVLLVLEKTSSGWWFVERHGEQGWVPESYLEPHAAQDTQIPAFIRKSTAADEDSDESSEDSDGSDQGKHLIGSLANTINPRPPGSDQGKHLTGSLANTINPRPPAPSFKASPKPPALPSKPSQDPKQGPERNSRMEAETPTSGLAGALKARFESKPSAEKPGPPGLPSRAEKPKLPTQTDKPKLPGLSEKPKLPGQAAKPSLPTLPSKPGVKPGLSSRPAERPKPPPVPGKSEPPSLPTKPERSEEDSVPTGVAGIANALRSKFESKEEDSTPTKPSLKAKLSAPLSKPALPSKSFGGSSGDSQKHSGPPTKPNQPAKPSWVKNSGASSDVSKPHFPLSKTASGPPKLPSKPYSAAKTSSDSNNNTSSSDKRPVPGKVHSMASAFASKPDAKDSGRPILPTKKPTLPQTPAQKPGSKVKDMDSDRPRVGNLVSELGSKLQFGGSGGGVGGGGGGGGNNDSAHRGPTSPPFNSKTGPWSNQSQGQSPASSPLAKAAPWSAQQNVNKSRQPSSAPKSPPPVPSTAKSLPTKKLEFEAVADFSAEGDGEVCLRCGDIVEVVDQQQKDWWLVKAANGDEGWAPSSYLEPANEWDD